MNELALPAALILQVHDELVLEVAKKPSPMQSRWCARLWRAPTHWTCHCSLKCPSGRTGTRWIGLRRVISLDGSGQLLGIPARSPRRIAHMTLRARREHRSSNSRMPTYHYRCSDCGHSFDYFQKFADDPLTSCPNARARFGACSTSRYRVQGSGWYINDSRDSKKSIIRAAGRHRRRRRPNPAPPRRKKRARRKPPPR